MVKIWEIFLFVSTKYTYVTNGRKDRQTDRQTPHDGIASRGKNATVAVLTVTQTHIQTSTDCIVCPLLWCINGRNNKSLLGIITALRTGENRMML